MMSAPTTWFTGLRNVLITAAAIALATPIGLYAFTDFPAKWGWPVSKQDPEGNNVPATHAPATHAPDAHAHAGHDAGKLGLN